MSSWIDHLVWGAPDLEAGRDEIESLLGHRPIPGGVHPGVGTRNALLGLEDERYFEVLAPDPRQSTFTGFGRWIETLDQSRLVTWAGRTDDLEALVHRARAHGLEPSPIVDMERRKPDGTTLRWRLATVDGHPFGPLVPFFIQWIDGHPCDTLEPVTELRSLRLATPDPEPLREILSVLELDREPITVAPITAAPITMESASEPGLVVDLVGLTLSSL